MDTADYEEHDVTYDPISITDYKEQDLTKYPIEASTTYPSASAPIHTAIPSLVYAVSVVATRAPIDIVRRKMILCKIYKTNSINNIII